MSMEQIPSEANSYSANQAILRLLRNPKFRYHVDKDPAASPHPEPSEPSPHPPLYFPKNHSYIMFPSTPNCSNWPHPFMFS
jgi:hypothetical protein